MKRLLERPLGTLSALGTTAIGAFHLEALLVLLQWGWASLGQIFYMATLLVSSAPVLPVSQTFAAKLVAALGALLLLKLGLAARKQVNKRLENSDT